jgi:predicted SAM-dependent methyltransferase
MSAESLRPWLKEQVPRGLRRALNLLRREIKVARLHRTARKKAATYRGRTGLMLNVGCGSNRKLAWVNIDLSDDADLCLDMREEIPMPNGSCTLIYSEHFLEHLDYPEDAKRFLSECYRLPEPAGVFSVGVPDTERPLQEYAEVRRQEYSRNATRWHPSWCNTPLEHINYHFRQANDHRFAYDFDTLRRALADAGFVNVIRRQFDRSLDSEDRRLGTLYVDARKPR